MMAYTKERAAEVINEIVWGDICKAYSAEALWEALVERMEERLNLEEMEIKTILGEIASRLGELDELRAEAKQRAAAKLAAMTFPVPCVWCEEGEASISCGCNVMINSADDLGGWCLETGKPICQGCADAVNDGAE